MFAWMRVEIPSISLTMGLVFAALPSGPEGSVSTLLFPSARRCCLIFGPDTLPLSLRGRVLMQNWCVPSTLPQCALILSPPGCVCVRVCV